ncbi:serine/threonine-protein kinase [Kribbella kalugense]|uniref:non-specific serine/threonine protein kinase n=1 Tax=Kribbella kalugense TaxID=2512221 RepID=A0A4R7ZWH4_9ACTN|nr:serine/threonine-protein kinase [Kribbella kalugense]TDW22095.1 serine/threonine protein kinase [Kribbella kalugense]
MADVFAGRYELIDPIGAGGNSMVWRAWDRRLRRFCAAKVLRQRHAGSLLRFVREQGLRLDHPHVLSPYSWVAEDDQALLAMDLVGGGSADNLVADFGALPERYAAELLAQLLGALDQVHAAGLLHRDVKPANLLLETTGTGPPVLRLSDFGIALWLGQPRLTQDGAVVGTPGYVAPEALAGEPASISQDLYAAGVTGWQFLTGEEPPLTGPPRSRPADAADDSVVWQVVESLMQPEAANRARSAEDALAALAPLLAQPLELPALTPDGEPIEVFDHLPPLPAPYATLADPPEALGHAVHREAGTPPSQIHPLVSGKRRIVVLAALTVAVLATATLVALLTLDGRPAGHDSPPPSQPTVPETISTRPVTPAPNAEAKVGGTCGWQEAGNLETTAGGTRIVCRQQGSSYRWIKAG